MSQTPDQGTRWRLLRDVVVFQLKLMMEAVLDITLIPASLAAAGLDFVLGNWRRPKWFHAMLGFGERCEHWIDLWRVGEHGAQSEADAVMRNIAAVIRQPTIGPVKVRELRRWAATKLAPDNDGDSQHTERRDGLDQ